MNQDTLEDIERVYLNTVNSAYTPLPEHVTICVYILIIIVEFVLLIILD